MSVQAVADKVASIVKSKRYDFVMAPPDMVGVFLFLLPILLKRSFPFSFRVFEPGILLINFRVLPY
jgi:hypothetical protein